MIWDTTDRSKVFVVDANTADYESLVQVSAQRNTEVVFFRTGKDALRSTPEHGPAMWIVNMDLPDMRGTDLQSLLRHRGNRSPLALVGDEYRPEDEIVARCAGAEMYFAKSMVHEAVAATA